MKINCHTLFLAGSLALAVPASAVFTLVDDFEGHTLGADLDADADWSAQAGANPTTGGTIISDGGSQAAQILGGSNNGSYYTGLGTQTISNNTTGTMFFRFRSDPAAWLQTVAYLTDWQPDSNSWWNHDEAGFYGRWSTSPDGHSPVAPLGLGRSAPGRRRCHLVQRLDRGGQHCQHL